METQELLPKSLTQLAVEKLVGSLEHSIRRLNDFTVKELQKRVKTTRSKLKTPMKEAATAKPLSLSNIESTKTPRQYDKETFNKELQELLKFSKKNECGISPHDAAGCTQAALRMMEVRKYIMTYAKADVQPLLLREVIRKAIETKNIPLVRLVLKENVAILDFRALEKWQGQKCSLSEPFIDPMKSFQQSSSSISHESNFSSAKRDAECSVNTSDFVCDPNALPLVIHCLPPDEFDWFSRDRMGKIISMQEACELFSIIRMTRCTPKLKELYINSRRSTYWVCPKDVMEIVADALIQMPRLTTLVLRGLCDDEMLKIIGKTATGLKRLDVSASQFVTDNGIRNLFFKEVTENAATYLVQAWIKKNLKRMNNLVHTLETLDYSWTSVTTLSRKMVQHIPGSYIFKRVFARNENDCYGHHIFIRYQAEFVGKIPTNPDHPQAIIFEANLEKSIGVKGVRSFMKFNNMHPWAGCVLRLHLDSQHRTGRNIPEKAPSYGIIIPNEDERRVHGVVNFQDGKLVEMYSVFPVKMSYLGECCSKLRVFRGILNGTWKLNTSFLPDLTSIDVFADPQTVRSLLENSPNLRKVRIRILRQQLKDEHLLKTIASSMCRRTLEDIWIAPGSYKNKFTKSLGSTVEYTSSISAYNQGVPKEPSTLDTLGAPAPKLSLVYNEVLPTAGQSSVLEVVKPDDSPIEDLIMLTLDCFRALVESCPKLNRLGDIAWWTSLTQPDVEELCEELKARPRATKISFIWENHIFST